jgi:ADP-heptose:LPS heptosyltransferase
MTKILAYRFSAMGDVILLLPALKGLLDANKDVEVYLLTQSAFFPFFNQIERLHLVDIDLKNTGKGFWGLFKTYLKVKKQIQPDLVIDFHGVLRTFFLDFLFAVTGYKVIKLKKGTIQKQIAIRFGISKILTGTVERYAETFRKAGYSLSLTVPPLFTKDRIPTNLNDILGNSLLIGIAPFAKHPQKIWGLEKIDHLIESIIALYDAKIVLFGAGQTECEQLDLMALKYQNCVVSARHFKLGDEVKFMPRLRLMISMDSANMHFAAMAGVPTVSIWGATHPALGFGPYQQPAENIIQYTGNQLSCRPCSVYGNKICKYSDGIRCMQYVTVEMVMNRVRQIIPYTLPIKNSL